VCDCVERRFGADDPREHDRAGVGLGRELRGDRLAEQLVEVRAEPMRSQQFFDVARARHDLERAGVGDEDKAVRLDRSWPVDRFAVAGGNVRAVRSCTAVYRLG
jgi:hypothetical protein